VAVQVPEQLLINPSLELTVPLPAPAVFTVSVKRCTSKVAVTDLAALIVTVQVIAATVSHPLQPPKMNPLPGLAVSVTVVPPLKVAAQVPGHLIDPSLELTVPPPVPATLTVSRDALVHTTNAWKSKTSGTGLNMITRHPRGSALSSVGSPVASEMGKESETCIFSGLTELSVDTRPPPVATSDPLHKTWAVPVVSVATVTAADRKT